MKKKSVRNRLMRGCREISKHFLASIYDDDVIMDEMMACNDAMMLKAQGPQFEFHSLMAATSFEYRGAQCLPTLTRSTTPSPPLIGSLCFVLVSRVPFEYLNMNIL